jgi:hypothetical protein
VPAIYIVVRRIKLIGSVNEAVQRTRNYIGPLLEEQTAFCGYFGFPP